MNPVWFILAVAQPEAGADGLLPPFGWIAIVTTLATTVASLGALYKGARDREVEVTKKLAEAEASKVALVEKIGQRTSDLLERAIEAFNTNKNNNDLLAARLTEQIEAISDLESEIRRSGEALTSVREEVRRVSEKVDRPT